LILADILVRWPIVFGGDAATSRHSRQSAPLMGG